MRRLRMLSAVAAVLLAAGWAQALTPDQVLVLVNSNERVSVALGRWYCAQRGVPEGNLVALPMPTTGTISQDVYRTQLVHPLRQEITRRGLAGRIRCILTIRGVPIRIKAPPLTPDDQAAYDWAKLSAERSHGQLATDVALMERIGKDFPAKAATATDLSRVGDFFDGAVHLAEPLPAVDDLLVQFKQLAQSKADAVASLADPHQRLIAERQYLALNLDALGLPGEISALQYFSPPGVPDTQTLTTQLNRLKQNRPPLLAGQQVTQVGLDQLTTWLRLTGGASAVYAFTNPRASKRVLTASQSAVDNELPLLWWKDYRMSNFLPNPLYWKYNDQLAQVEQQVGRVLMVSRLDGPDLANIMRMVTDSIAVEKTGLKGVFYVDAGQGPNPRATRAFNNHLLVAAHIIRSETDIPVKLDQNAGVFPPGSCPDAALYVGWYSLKKYVPAFTWVRGAVGYHVASYEAMNIRDPKSTEWVPRMIQSGVAATLGATDEPLLESFPLPEEFFPLLVTGKLTVCETYWRTCPWVSWRLMLIGDPLYNPFKNNPQPVFLPAGLMPTPATAPASGPASAPATGPGGSTRPASSAGGFPASTTRPASRPARRVPLFGQ